MERRKVFGGWECTLSPKEVQCAEKDMVLRGDLKKWTSQPDGSATLRVAPWLLGSSIMMEMFIEGLSELFATINVEMAGGVEIVTREY